jgi:hypothetical protein
MGDASDGRMMLALAAWPAKAAAAVASLAKTSVPCIIKFVDARVNP